MGEFDSDPGSVSTSLGIMQNGVHTITLESLGIAKDEWISILEVRIQGPEPREGWGLRLVLVPRPSLSSPPHGSRYSR